MECSISHGCEAAGFAPNSDHHSDSDLVIPDIFELNDWVLMNMPEVYEASKRLHSDVQFKLWDGLHQKAGRPDISAIHV